MPPVVPIAFKDIERLCEVRPGRRVRIRDFDPGWTGGSETRGMSKQERIEFAKTVLGENLAELFDAQDRLWADDRYSVLVVLQALDAAGKDGIIKHVMSGLNPQGCQVHSFKRPSDEELDHNFLWRYARALPSRGAIGIFNRSYYEEVLVVRVHPEILERQKLPDGKRGQPFWDKRYDDINRFERHLARNGTLLVKILLHVSKGEQKRRFLERLEDPKKHWKFSAADLHERAFWSSYQDAFEEMLNRTSTKWAPWMVIPADHKWIARALVSTILTHRIKSLGVRRPTVSPEQKRQLARARRRLLAEP
jgi:PPK2 family polyphosphate:nucleotide phosphotransferase